MSWRSYRTGVVVSVVHWLEDIASFTVFYETKLDYSRGDKDVFPVQPFVYSTVIDIWFRGSIFAWSGLLMESSARNVMILSCANFNDDELHQPIHHWQLSFISECLAMANK